MDLNYVKNCCTTAPGMATHGASSPLAKYSNTLYVKANGLVGTPIATADCPSFALSKGRRNATTTNIPTLKARYYTLLAAVNPTTSVVTFSWVHGDDFSEITDIGRTKYINGGNAENQDEKKAIIGYVCIINGSSSDFIPGTTNLDASGIAVVYQDQFGFQGM